MLNITFTLKGIGFEHGFICIDCVTSVLKCLREEDCLGSISFSSVRKEFTVASATDSMRRIRSAIARAADRAGESFNKTFVPDNIRRV